MAMCDRIADVGSVLSAIDIVCFECCEYDPDAYDPCAGCPVRITADRLWDEWHEWKDMQEGD